MLLFIPSCVNTSNFSQEAQTQFIIAKDLEQDLIKIDEKVEPGLIVDEELNKKINFITKMAGKLVESTFEFQRLVKESEKK